jgi:hypothetical protein
MSWCRRVIEKMLRVSSVRSTSSRLNLRRRAAASSFRDGAPGAVPGASSSVGLGCRVVYCHCWSVTGEESHASEDADCSLHHTEMAGHVTVLRAAVL